VVKLHGMTRVSLTALVLYVLALAGMTLPKAAQAQSASKPLRHLEYSFSVDEEGMSEYHYNGIGNGIQTSAGVGGTASSEGGRGTMMVDVLSLSSDGALVVKIAEWVQNEPRARQSYTCTVYGNTAVVCPPVPAPSDAEWVLLSYLGRQFVDAAPWDAQRHWQRTQDTPQYRLVEDFTMVDQSDEKLALIKEKKKISMHNGDFGNRSENVQITYDRAMEVPQVVHDDMDLIGTSGSQHSSFDFHLTADSFAKGP
jgi:hypothetical protein